MKKHSHEVRVGMSVYWVSTETNEDGEVDWRANGRALSGTASDVAGALAQARQALRATETVT